MISRWIQLRRISTNSISVHHIYFHKQNLFFYFFEDFKCFIFSMADESVVALLARENKNAVMLLNERRRALKWEERQGKFQNYFNIFFVEAMF